MQSGSRKDFVRKLEMIFTVCFMCLSCVCLCLFVVCVVFYSGGGVESPGDFRFVGSGFPHLNAREVVEALGKWEGTEDTISLFADLVKDNSTYLHIHHIQ